ncbi:CaiB/BaiF CoA transferase family protein [Nocardia sp. CA-135953]|uniref:CaiB/BaiF CoA transferase family protein n=1 Tax=Nocardia sp. CA-135953 TaxID=3239978 RepID=UPI003D9652D3
MTAVMRGIRVVELATWGFIPSAGVALADWGAEVIKIEHPEHGDPMRGLVPSSLKSSGTHPVSFMFQTFSRGKASVGIDLTTEGGREALHRLVETADVFLTNYLPSVRRKLGVDVEDLQAINPKLIYVKGSGLGPDGDEADTGGFDLASYWSRGGVAHVTTGAHEPWPAPMPGAAFGDLQGGLYAAGGVAAALFDRERTGTGHVVDVSLLGAAVWVMAPHIAASTMYGIDAMAPARHELPSNPIANTYRTSDDRYIALVMLESDRFWAPLVELMGRGDLAADPRFADATARSANSAECVIELEKIFAAHSLADWCELLSKQRGVWAVVQTPKEVGTDPQVLANKYVGQLDLGPGGTIGVGMPPIQFDRRQPDPSAAPELGADTDRLLQEVGYDWDRLIELKIAGAIN